MTETSQPTTVASYRHVRANLIACTSALTTLAETLGPAVAVPLEPVDLANVGHVAGFVEHALVRLEVLLGPLKLDTLPAGIPGQKVFEVAYARQVSISRAYGVAHDVLQLTHRLLGSPCHRLELPEAERAFNWRDARRNQIIGELEQSQFDTVELDKTRRELEAHTKRLLRELEEISGGTLFTTAPLVP